MAGSTVAACWAVSFLLVITPGAGLRHRGRAAPPDATCRERTAGGAPAAGSKGLGVSALNPKRPTAAQAVCRVSGIAMIVVGAALIVEQMVR